MESKGAGAGGDVCGLPKMTAGLSFVILYGSQLGQAKSLAEGLCDITSNYGLTTQVFSLNEIKEIIELQQTNLPIVIITSTTGDGEAPENADKFFRKLRRKTVKPDTLQSVRYTILGLGDTNYNDFCNCAKTIHRRFQDLGAQLFYQVAWADDAVGQEQVIENWIDGLWPAILEEIGLVNGAKLSLSGDSNSIIMSSTTKPLTLPSCPQPFINVSYLDIPAVANLTLDLLHPPTPYPSLDGEPMLAKLTKAKLLTNEGSVKTTLEVTLTLMEEDKPQFEFQPGDAIGIVCPNSSAEITALLKRLNLEGNEYQAVELSLIPGVKNKFPPFLPQRSTIHELFKYFLDIRTAPKKAFLRLLAESTTDPIEKTDLLELSSREGSSKYEESIRFPSLSILDLLLKYPSCSPKLESLLEHLPRLIPRAFSITSSPFVSKTSFKLAFNLIEIPKENGRMYERLGVCTGWLFAVAQQCGFGQHKNDSGGIGGVDLVSEALQTLSLNGENKRPTTDIVFYKRKNHAFRLPVDLTAPVLMVGPGTGVAPFVGFLEHRHYQKQESSQVGPMVLYFGCRHREKDFLYQEVLERLKNESILTELNVTFSRDSNQGDLKYVQDLMEVNGKAVVSMLLENGGYLYVCGDAKNMAKSIREKLVRIIQNVKGYTEKEAENEVGQLVSLKRYLQDIWT